ncbi:MAG: hypothetical protein KY475_20140 [Planctomycetes bacterium]|nr:hypothetical protein [Planctomycetota bacterium]
MTPEKTKSRAVEREEWLAELERLISEAERWAAERDWLVQRESKVIDEPGLGAYDAPSLKIRRPDAVLPLETFAPGCVDFSVFPSFDRLLVLLTKRGWKFASPERRGGRRAWSKCNFHKVADELAARR